MNCKNLRIRTKNYQKYFYCMENKCIVNASTCYCCKNKEYKKSKIVKKKIVSNRSKACDITEEVKQNVWERDGYSCIFCKKLVVRDCANSHFIPRSAGGLGIEENIVTACPHCHHEQDNGKFTLYYDSIAEEYLKSKYENWDKDNLIYIKKYIKCP